MALTKLRSGLEGLASAAPGRISQNVKTPRAFETWSSGLKWNRIEGRQFVVRFADGTRMWLTTDIPSEIYLHPVFLKYLVLCVLLGGLLDQGGNELGLLEAQQVLVLWLALGLEALIWFLAVGWFIKKLVVRNVIHSLYTPLHTLPLLIITQTTTIQIVSLMEPDFVLSTADFLSNVIRDVVVVLIFDVIFSSYVARSHPAFSTNPVLMEPVNENPATQSSDTEAAPLMQGQNEPTPEESIDTAPAAELAPQDVGQDRLVQTASPSVTKTFSSSEKLQIGVHQFDTCDLIFLRSEDHYLTVQTRTRKELVRGKLSDAVEKLDVRLGIQISRSCWVAVAAIEELVDTPTGLYLTLSNGSKQKVATLRKHAVKASIDLYGIIGK